MKKPLVLVVDDEPDMANYIAKVVKETERYEVVIAHSAQEAFAALEKSRPLFGLGEIKVGCVLLDIKMPEMDGLQFLEKLRKEYQEKIGVIIVSAYEDEEKWRKASQGLVAGYIRKPFEDAGLITYLDSFFLNPGFTVQQVNQILFGKKVVSDFEKIREKHGLKAKTEIDKDRFITFRKPEIEP